MRARGITILALAAALCAGCGGQAQPTSGRADGHSAAAGVSAPHTAAAVPVAHPQAVEPVAGAAAQASAPAASSAASVSVGSAGGGSTGGGSTGGGSALPQPVTLAEVRRQLTESGMTASTTQATLTPGGLAVAPITAPAAVQAVIAAGNQIAKLPYVWGGGHMTYEDTGYDCSGSISYVFAAAHLLNHTVTSGQLESWGDPGPGKWITVFANAGHTFMYVAGLRFDTVALAETGSRWSSRPADESNLGSFSVRHPPGL